MVNTFTLPLFPSKPYPRFWGASHPDLEIRGRLGLKKKFFRSFGPQFGLKMGVGRGQTGPWIRHCRLQNRSSISIIGT